MSLKVPMIDLPAQVKPLRAEIRSLSTQFRLGARAIERIMQTTANDTVEGTLKTEVVCQVNGTNTDGTCKTSPITTGNVTVNYRLECTAAGGAISTQLSTDADAFSDLTCAAGSIRAGSCGWTTISASRHRSAGR